MVEYDDNRPTDEQAAAAAPEEAPKRRRRVSLPRRASSAVSARTDGDALPEESGSAAQSDPAGTDAPGQQETGSDEQVESEAAVVVAAPADSRAADVVFGDPEEQRPHLREHPVLVFGDHRQRVRHRRRRRGRPVCRPGADM